jgi:hypothetical protein
MPQRKIDKLIKNVNSNGKDPKVTENIFVSLEKDPDFLKRYEDLVKVHGKRKINTMIGKSVKAVYGLSNTGRKKASRTTLIKSFTLH